MLSPQIEAQLEELFRALRRYSFAWLNLIGQDRWMDFTVTRSGFTEIGTPTLTGRFLAVGRLRFFQVQIVPGTTIASVAGTSYIGLPVTPAAGFGGNVTMFNATTNVAVGTGGIDVANSRAYMPAQAATGNTLDVAAWYEI